jgi:hypothetical protein
MPQRNLLSSKPLERKIQENKVAYFCFSVPYEISKLLNIKDAEVDIKVNYPYGA